MPTRRRSRREPRPRSRAASLLCKLAFGGLGAGVGLLLGFFTGAFVHRNFGQPVYSAHPLLPSGEVVAVLLIGGGGGAVLGFVVGVLVGDEVYEAWRRR